MDVLVMGGTRFVGPPIVRRLREHGHRVTVFNRGTQPVDWHGDVREVHGDRDDPAALDQLLALSFDGVIDMSAYTTAQTAGLLRVLGDIPRFVHCSTGAVYAPLPVLPWREDDPLGPWPLWGSYGVDKLGGEHLLQARRPAELATTVIRPPYILGPGNFADREEFVLNRIVDGAEILIPGDGMAVQQFVTAEQVAQSMVAALEAFAEGYRVFNIAAPQFTSLLGFVAVCGQIAGREPAVRLLGDSDAGLVNGVFNRLEAVFPFPNRNYVLDVTASATAGIAPDPVTLAEMIEAAYDYLQSHPERRRWQRTPGEQRYLTGTA